MQHVQIVLGMLGQSRGCGCSVGELREEESFFREVVVRMEGELGEFRFQNG